MLSKVAINIEIIVKDNKFLEIKNYYEIINDTVTFKNEDLNAGETKKYLVNINLNRNKPKIILEVKYVSMVDGYNRGCNSFEYLKFSDDKPTVNIQVDKEKNRVVASLMLKEARRLADEDKIDEGKTVINDTIKYLQESYSKDEKFTRDLISDLETNLENLNEYEGKGKYEIASFNTQLDTQRCVSDKSKTGGIYSTSFTKGMEKLFKDN